jgi:hypothetical protein
MDAWIPRDGGVVPIYKLMRAAPLSSTVVTGTR